MSTPRVFSTALLIVCLAETSLKSAEKYPRTDLLVQPSDLAKAHSQFVILDAREEAKYDAEPRRVQSPEVLDNYYYLMIHGVVDYLVRKRAMTDDYLHKIAKQPWDSASRELQMAYHYLEEDERWRTLAMTLKDEWK